jgi:hypothetical protein
VRKQYGLKFDEEWMARVDAAAGDAGVSRTHAIELMVDFALPRLPKITSVDDRLSGPERVDAFRRAADRAKR